MSSLKLRLAERINNSPQYVIDPLRVAVYFIDTKKKWKYCANRLLNGQLMGFDTETRPTWSKHQKKARTALLQIAVRDVHKKEEVFILDLLKLPPTVYNSTLTSVFLSTKTIKLGQGFYHDLQELSQAYPHATCFMVCKEVVEMNDLSISLTGAHNLLGLQKLVFFYLHRKLAKTQQTSNWERRPLTASQLHYAAADALVLLHLYDEMLLRIQNQRKMTKVSFQLSDVTNVLDVNVPPSPKCELCLEVFESILATKLHRKECLTNARKLLVCAECQVKDIVTEKAMGEHEESCGQDDAHDEPVVQVDRKRAFSKISKSEDDATSLQAAATQPNLKKRRKLKREVKAAKNMDASNSGPRKEEKKKRKRQNDDEVNPHGVAEPVGNQKTKVPTLHKKRKMSISRECTSDDAKVLQSTAAQPKMKKRRKLKPEMKAAKSLVVSNSKPKQQEETHVNAQKKGGKRLKKQAALLKTSYAAEPAAIKTTQTPSCRDLERKRRKMSMESSLLTSDALWSQISSDATNVEVA